jgi:hypothetical protein
VNAILAAVGLNFRLLLAWLADFSRAGLAKARPERPHSYKNIIRIV